MNQHHYPCFVLSRTNISRTCYLSFYLDSGRFFTVEESVYYDDIAMTGLQKSHSVKVPFYNEVQS